MSDSFPFDRTGALLDAIRNYWEHPNRDPTYNRANGPGYQVTIRRADMYINSIPKNGAREWEEDWLSHPPPELADIDSYPPARPPWQWRELPPPEARPHVRLRLRRDVCPKVAADPRGFVDGEEVDFSEPKEVILRCHEMKKPPG